MHIVGLDHQTWINTRFCKFWQKQHWMNFVITLDINSPLMMQYVET